MELLTAFAIGLTFATGVYLFLRRNVIRSVMGLMIIANAINLFLLACGAYVGEEAAYVNYSGQHSDALPQALILTAIVISLGGTAFVLALLYVLAERYETGDMDEVTGLKH